MTSLLMFGLEKVAEANELTGKALRIAEIKPEIRVYLDLPSLLDR